MTYFLFKITGIVQGVGFRPFIYREAQKRGLVGYVQNTGQGVEILCNDKNIMLEILEELPPLAKIANVKVEKLSTTSSNSHSLEERFLDDFRILFSETNSENKKAKIPTDTSICDDCVKELLNKKNRRHKYFFISCTNCGPRYSISKKLPFDRENTSLKSFQLCSDCEQEYKNPADRRFHAQTIACEQCGPKLEFYENGKKLKTDPLSRIIDLIKKGEIVSIKGIGGFSLFSLANKNTGEKLRKLLNRPHKPFAIMVKDLEMAQKFVEISKKEAEILAGKERPIVLCRKKSFCHSEFSSESDNPKILKHPPGDSLLCESHNSPQVQDDHSSLSPNNRIGVMLPYTALHHLFFEGINEPLIVTSANMPGLPIPTKKEEQNWPYILDYNREITNFSDDSIIKVIEDHPLIIRRSRGFVPNEISIPINYQNFAEEIIAVGGEMKNTFCIKKGNSLKLSPHIGNTFTLENLDNFKKTLNKSTSTPQTILSDQNKTFNTSLFAKNYAIEKDIEHKEHQHHLAHIFSVAMEHDLDNFIGIAADGTGIGNDANVWGGEVFHNDKRIGHLEYQSLVRGDISNKEPVRFLIGILSKFLDKKEINKILEKLTSSEINIYQTQSKEKNIQTSSCGRIIDAAAILLGFGEKNHYEGYLAEMLELNTIHPLNPPCEGDFIEPVIKKQNDQYILKTTELFQFLVENLDKIPRKELATFVQLYLAKGFYLLAMKGNDDNLPIVFSGGCTYNEIITSYLLSKGIKVNKNIPPGDGGISAGQIGYFLWKNKFI